jgi:hypothetical protein
MVMAKMPEELEFHSMLLSTKYEPKDLTIDKVKETLANEDKRRDNRMKELEKGAVVVNNVNTSNQRKCTRKKCKNKIGEKMPVTTVLCRECFLADRKKEEEKKKNDARAKKQQQSQSQQPSQQQQQPQQQQQQQQQQQSSVVQQKVEEKKSASTSNVIVKSFNVSVVGEGVSKELVDEDVANRKRQEKNVSENPILCRNDEELEGKQQEKNLWVGLSSDSTTTNNTILSGKRQENNREVVPGSEEEGGVVVNHVC